MKEPKRPTHCYKGRCRGCGQVVASCYDMPDYAKETAKMVAEMIAGGLMVAHEPFPGAPMSECTCPKPERQEQLL